MAEFVQGKLFMGWVMGGGVLIRNVGVVAAGYQI